jgi:hypothetical protein
MVLVFTALVFISLPHVSISRHSAFRRRARIFVELATLISIVWIQILRLNENTKGLGFGSFIRYFERTLPSSVCLL